MVDRIYPVPADWTTRGAVDEAGYEERVRRVGADGEGYWLAEAARLDWATGCQEPRAQQLQATLVAADRLVSRLTGMPEVQRMHSPRPPGMLNRPEHTPQ